MLSGPKGHSAAGRIRSIEKSNDLIGTRTRDLPACSIEHQPTTLPRAPLSAWTVFTSDWLTDRRQKYNSLRMMFLLQTKSFSIYL
jgi:hypothetical protein